MKKSCFFCFIWLFVIFQIVATPQSLFEGVVHIAVDETDGDAQFIEYFAKKGQYMLKGSEGENILILDKKMVVIVHDQKMYIEIPLDGKGADLADANIPETKSEEDNTSSITKTNETKDILGFSCVKWQQKDSEGTTDIWLTDELGAFMMFGDKEKAQDRWKDELSSIGFPMQIIENGKTVFEVKKVEKKSLDQSLFEIPEGYQKMAIPGFDQMFKPE